MKKDTTFRKAIPADKRLAIGLFTLASVSEYQVIGAVFGVSKVSVMRCFKAMVFAITKSPLYEEYIRIPTAYEFMTIAKEIEARTGYPNACGIIDGTHIRIKVPIDQRESYYDHNEDFSVLTLAICDHLTRIWWFKSGIPGCSHDSGGFNDTNIEYKLRTGQVLPPSQRHINNVLIPYHILGDAAFSQSRFMAKPFKRQAYMEGHKLLFNKIHSKARVTIEHAFGRLKGRWRRLLKDPMELKLDHTATVVAAAITLHNICESVNDIYYNDWPLGRHHSLANFTSQVSAHHNGDEDYRLAIADHFLTTHHE